MTVASEFRSLQCGDLALSLELQTSTSLCGGTRGIFTPLRVHSSALLGEQCAACGEANAEFADESACLMVENIRNEVVTIQRSLEVLKMPSSPSVDTFSN